MGSVVGVYESSSPDFLDLYHRTDAFRGSSFDDEFLPTTIVNNKYAREITAQQIYTVKKARNGGFVLVCLMYQSTTSYQAYSRHITHESSIILPLCIFRPQLVSLR